MSEVGNTQSHRIGAMELLCMGGFALFFGWMFIAYYWLIVEELQSRPEAVRIIPQLLVFVGCVLGYVILHYVGQTGKYTPFSIPALATTVVLSLPGPLVALLLGMGFDVPIVALCVISVCTGMAGASFTVSWLSLCGRVRIVNYQRFVSQSLLGGGLLFIVVSFLPLAMQPVFCLMYALMSGALLFYLGGRRGSENDEEEASQEKSVWAFAREIEPSFIAFGVVFGLTFAYLFNKGPLTMLIGLACTVIGSGFIALLSWRGKSIGITVMQRILLCITVLSCVLIPFVSSTAQLLCACLVLVAWAAFTSVNYTLIVEKCIEQRGTAAFRQIPSRLMFSMLGFCAGWIVAAIAVSVVGSHTEVYTVIRLSMAFILVVVVMLFFPTPEHHGEEPLVKGSVPEVPVVVHAEAVGLSENDLFELRCDAVAKLYQLSPRETDILKYLAKGRNAAYIQDKFCISPHTVKSHIYSIYRKVDIHSQQKLMDFVEEYPVTPPQV